jgi:hypothetical protein
MKRIPLQMSALSPPLYTCGTRPVDERRGMNIPEIIRERYQDPAEKLP